MKFKLIKFNNLSLVMLSIFAFQGALAGPIRIYYDEIELNNGCPKGYVLVPSNPDYTTPTPGKDFCVMKYEASKLKNESGERAVSVKKVPWVNINRTHAIAACAANGPGYHLITNSEWMTIARNIEATPENWSGGRIGEGVLPRGNSNSDEAEEAVAPGRDDNSNLGTNYYDWTHKRTHTLSNGEVIWDIAGNVWEWVSDDLRTEQDGDGWHEYNNAAHFSEGSQNQLFFAPLGSYSSTKNVGKIYMSNPGGATLRGGYWDDDAYAGVFAVRLFHSASDSGTAIGFRCAYTPQHLRSRL